MGDLAAESRLHSFELSQKSLAPRPLKAARYVALEEVVTPPAKEADQKNRGPRQLVRAVFEDSPVQYLVVGVILLSTACVIAESVPEVMQANIVKFQVLEKTVTCFFTVEICIRILIAEKACAYFFSLANLIDILATLPWYIDFLLRHAVAGSHFDQHLADAFQLIRLMRVLRLIKAARHSSIITTVFESIRGSLEGLSTLMAFVFMGTVFSATVVFFLERKEPDTAFVSIPAAVWWALPTVTGVGYGDMVPQTIAGKLAGSCTMVGGVLITSLSVAITTHSFIENFQRNIQRVKVQQQRRSMNRSPLSGLVASASGQDLASMAFDEEPVHENLMARLPQIEEELNGLLSELQGSLSSPSEAAALIGTPLDGARTGLRTSVELLQEQSKVWFRQVTRITGEVSRLESEARPRLDTISTNT